MPIEVLLLENEPAPLTCCPKCGDAPFRPFMRGQVQRMPWPWWSLFGLFGGERPYCALICWQCKDIVGYE